MKIRAVICKPYGRVLIKMIEKEMLGKMLTKEHSSILSVFYSNEGEENEYCGLKGMRETVIFTGRKGRSLDQQLANIVAFLCKTKSVMIGDDEGDKDYPF